MCARALFGALRRAAAGCLQCTAVRSHGCVAFCDGFLAQLDVPKSQALDRWSSLGKSNTHEASFGARLQRLSRPSVTLGPGRRGLSFSFGFLVATASCTLAKSKLGPAQTLGTAASRNTDAQELL